MSRHPPACIPRHGRTWVRLAALAFTGVWLLTPGCASTQGRARQESAERWNRVRAQVKMKLASDQLAAGHIEDAATELAAAVSLDPANPKLLTLQARVCLARGDLTGAERVLAGAPAENELRAEVEYLLGIIAEQRLHWTEALERYVGAADADPHEVAYVVAIVQVMLQLGQTDDALALLESYEPEFGWTNAYHAALAECCEQLEDWPAAASAWRKVADIHDDPDIRDRLAVALYRAGDAAEATRLFERLLDDAEAESTTHLRLALAQCLLAEGQAAAAHEQLDILLHDDPQNVPALQFDARVLAEQGQFERAREIAERALRLANDDVRALELAATLALRVGDSDRAFVLAKRIAQIAPDLDSSVARQILAQLSSATPPVE
jgi:tetratricopeptide (TPR) repeat protein